MLAIAPAATPLSMIRPVAPRRPEPTARERVAAARDAGTRGLRALALATGLPVPTVANVLATS